MPVSGWHQDSVLHYVVPVSDTLSTYDILLSVRHTTQYPYQNLWMFITEWQDSACLLSDTIECYLADDRGRWLGSGINTYEMPLIYTTVSRTRATTFLPSNRVCEQKNCGAFEI